jgi:hypothetical protein
LQLLVAVAVQDHMQLVQDLQPKIVLRDLDKVATPAQLNKVMVEHLEMVELTL